MVRRRDLIATAIVVALVVAYLAYLALGELPLIADGHAMTSVALMLGGTAIAVLLSDDADDPMGWFTLAFAVVAVVIGSVALFLPGTRAAEILLAAFVGSVLTVWAIQLAEHVTFTPTRGSRR